MLSCPAFLVAAPASGQGKTTVVAALARLHTRLGRKVRVFKCGPDFLDPQIHAIASNAPCQNVDLWMCGEADIAWRLAEAARTADLILIEGVMGLFDGSPSAADLAHQLGIPILAVIDGASMANSFGAIAYGLKHYRPGTPLNAAFANRVGSAYHAELLEKSLPPDIAWYGHLPRDVDAAMPERHLGLLPAAEIEDLAQRIDRMADLLATTAAAQLPPPVKFAEAQPLDLPRLLQGKTIAVARDAAFCFLYPANVECLEMLGAKLVYFSPLADSTLPSCNAVWFPGDPPTDRGSSPLDSAERIRLPAIHQQPPHIPLCFSTSRAKSDQVLSSRGFTMKSDIRLLLAHILEEITLTSRPTINYTEIPHRINSTPALLSPTP